MSLTVLVFAMIMILCVVDLGSCIASQVQMDADGSNLTPTEMLVKQAIRQNIRGHMTQPLSMLQWTHLVLQSAFPAGRPADALEWKDPGRRKEVGRTLCRTFENLLAGYHSGIEAQGIDLDGPIVLQLRH